MNSQMRYRGAGFSLVELLVTIVLAGIIFAAMVPVFVGAMKRTSTDNQRVTATNIAQDRIEQIRLLKYTDVTGPNLNYSPSPPANPFGDNRFGPIYTVIGTSKPYLITYVVDPANDPDADSKTVTVNVKASATGFNTTAQTILKNPAAESATSTSGATPTALPTTNLSITCSFKDWSQVVTSGHNPWGVVVVYKSGTPTPTVTVTVSPTKCPISSATTVVWTGLPGGPNITYTVTCHSQYIDATSPPFHLLKSAPNLHFDTHPGGS